MGLIDSTVMKTTYTSRKGTIVHYSILASDVNNPQQTTAVNVLISSELLWFEIKLACFDNVLLKPI